MQPTLRPVKKNKPKRGLIVGKFWPFHLGHEYLMKVGQEHCDELYVIICNRKYHSPSGQIRALSVQDSYPTVYVMVIEDVYDSADSLLWAKLSLVWCKFKPDIVFTSESYGADWAKALDCEHYLVDLQRSVVPISGTEVRDDPLQSWKYLPPRIREFYCRRVVIVGSESTGKTTLSQLLAIRYQCPWVSEYGRELCERKLPSGGGGNAPEYIWTDDDFEEILRIQSLKENEACQQSSNGFIFCDTNIFATVIWYERYMKKSMPKKLVDIYNSCYTPPSLYVLLQVNGSSFVQDGYRDGEIIRNEMEKLFVNKLQQQNIALITFDGVFEERTNSAINYFDLFVKKNNSMY
jgi:NadR type nicotinamide-nucleotide adenylyltransferase